MSTHLWHPFADMAAVKDDEVVIVRGRGARVWDADGREYVDARAGLWYAAVGHGRTEIADAVAAQMRELAAFDTFDRLANRPALELADRVSALAPFADAAVFFSSRRLRRGRHGRKARPPLLARARAARQAPDRPPRAQLPRHERLRHEPCRIPTNREGFGDADPRRGQRAARRPGGAGARCSTSAPSEIAAFIGEPVIGAGGIIHPPGATGSACRRSAGAHDVLLIADEVVTGFGRLGRWFGMRAARHRPRHGHVRKGDHLGLPPAGRRLISSRIQEPFWTEPGRAIFRHGFTYSGHPAACAAGLANLDVIEREGLLDRVAELEAVLARAVEPLTDLPLSARYGPDWACWPPSRSIPSCAPPIRAWSSGS